MGLSKEEIQAKSVENFQIEFIPWTVPRQI